VVVCGRRSFAAHAAGGPPVLCWARRSPSFGRGAAIRIEMDLASDLKYAESASGLHALNNTTCQKNRGCQPRFYNARDSTALSGRDETSLTARSDDFVGWVDVARAPSPGAVAEGELGLL
jgi:hypothetical protein